MRRQSFSLTRTSDGTGCGIGLNAHMPATDGVHLLIVDDHAVVREGLEAMLGGAPGIARIRTAGGAAEAITACQAAVPDVMLLDLRMPDGDGLQILERIRADWPTVRVLILSASVTAADLSRAERAGAVGCLSKSSDRAALLTAIRLAAAGGTCFASDVVSVSDHGLSQRELEVLSHLVRGLSNDDLGRLLGVSAETIKSHLKSIFSKLGVAGRTEAVARAFELGLVAR